MVIFATMSRMYRFIRRARDIFQCPHYVYFITAAVLVIALLLYSQGVVDRVREDIAFALSPSAQRAYEYGNTNFSGQNPRQYDLKRAEMWFEEALRLDPTLRGVHHQLARVSFLKGDFTKAMERINTEINLPSGPISPSSYYIRGLIEGYMGNYANSANDYEKYLESDPNNWAALNDLAWVLLKGQKFEEAADVTARGLKYSPDNPWLLNSSATAFFELGRYDEALAQATKAQSAVAGLSEKQWLTAYPGNDPRVARTGIATFQKAVGDNIHAIMMKIASSTVQ